MIKLNGLVLFGIFGLPKDLKENKDKNIIQV
jgi:hypothetical protein